MLILSRRKEEDIVIQIDNATVVVRVIDIRPDRVRLGVTAPNAVSVMRSELIETPPENPENGLERPDRTQPV